MDNQNTGLRDSVVDVASAFLSNNNVSVDSLGTVIANIAAALRAIHDGPVIDAASVEVVDKPTAAQIKKSVTPDQIVSFINGKPYKSMRRHLTTNGYTPETYRERFGLPADYPIVAKNYAEERSALAKSIGLGNNINRGGATPPAADAPAGDTAADDADNPV